MAIDLNLIDKLLADYKKPEDIIGENGGLVWSPPTHSTSNWRRQASPLGNRRS